MFVIAFLLSLATIMLFVGERIINTTALQRFGYVILALILAPILWVIGVALIIDYIFRNIVKEEYS
jgi:hypothetical protein